MGRHGGGDIEGEIQREIREEEMQGRKRCREGRDAGDRRQKMSDETGPGTDSEARGTAVQRVKRDKGEKVEAG